QGIAEVIRNVAKLSLDKPLSKAASK
ncbi:MAG: hypothetical protein ACI9LX_001718, partial [Paraglaciecola sp.]